MIKDTRLKIKRKEMIYEDGQCNDWLQRELQYRQIRFIISFCLSMMMCAYYYFFIMLR